MYVYDDKALDYYSKDNDGMRTDMEPPSHTMYPEDEMYNNDISSLTRVPNFSYAGDQDVLRNHR